MTDGVVVTDELDFWIARLPSLEHRKQKETPDVSMLRLCDGADDEQVDHLHKWMEDHLPDAEWEGGGCGITVWVSEGEPRAVLAGEWMVVAGKRLVVMRDEDVRIVFGIPPDAPKTEEAVG